MSQCSVQAADWPAVVQAWGSILAILAIGIVAWWQSSRAQSLMLATIEQQRKEDNHRTADTLLAMAESALKLQKHVAAKLNSREAIYEAAEDNRMPFEMPEVNALVTSFDAIELHALPAALIPLTLMVRSSLRQFRDKIVMVFDLHKKMDAAQFDDFFATMASMQKSMEDTISDMSRILGDISTELALAVKAN
ncbi:hypothetical protein SAMN05446635_0223 [Burkholderia sp. OK233]|nr:hypothetical protein SAMN05446635_0223 [Burkholderia sp. OK233]